MLFSMLSKWASENERKRGCSLLMLWQHHVSSLIHSSLKELCKICWGYSGVWFFSRRLFQSCSAKKETRKEWGLSHTHRPLGDLGESSKSQIGFRQCFFLFFILVVVFAYWKEVPKATYICDSFSKSTVCDSVWCKAGWFSGGHELGVLWGFKLARYLSVAVSEHCFCSWCLGHYPSVSFSTSLYWISLTHCVLF